MHLHMYDPFTAGLVHSSPVPSMTLNPVNPKP